MRSCLHAQPVRSLKACVRPLGISRRQPTLPLRSRPPTTAAPGAQQYHQQRTMNVAAAAVPAVNAALAGISLGLLAAWLDAKLKSRKPDLYFTANEFNSAVLDRCPTMQSTYQCTPFLTNGHAETILVAKLRKPPGVVYKREIVLTQDGGAVAVDWEHVDDEGKDLPEDAPVLILFPGLTGGSGDSYVQHAVLQARHAGVRAAVFNSRGTADSPVLTPQFYSASFTEDTREVIAHVRQRYPDSTLYAAGWSLGANILVNYLGEQGPDTPLASAVSMCNPFDLTISNRHINEGFNKIYNWNLASSLKKIFLKHQPLWRTYQGPGQPERVPHVSTIREFDEAITVHSFDWKDVDAYYAGSSSAKRIPQVSIPLLCIQAADDPIAPEDAIPYAAIQQNPNCTLVVTPCGGHLGWAAGRGAPFSEPWTDAAVVEWLTSVHAQLQQQAAGQAGLTAAQQALQAHRSSSSSNRGGRDEDGDGGSSNGGGSNGGGSSGPQQQQQRELESAAAAPAPAHSNGNGSSMAATAAPALSRHGSNASGSSGSSAYISPTSSPASSSTGTSGLVMASSITTSTGSAASSRSCSRLQTFEQQAAAANADTPADLMEQMWWGQGLGGRAKAHQGSAMTASQQLRQHQRQQLQQQQQQAAVSQLHTAAPLEAAAAAVLPVQEVAVEQQQQQAIVPSPFAAVAGSAVPPGVEHPAAAAAAAADVSTEESVHAAEQTVAVEPYAVTAAAAAGSGPLTTAAAASTGAEPAAAGVQGRSVGSAVDQAQQELWQSVRWAF